MKKRILLFLLAILGSLAVKAQFTFGIQGGANKSWHNNYYFSGDAKPPKVDGLAVSALLYYRIGQHFQIGIEPGFTQRGFTEGNSNLILIDFFFDPTFGMIGPSSFAPFQTTRTIYSNYIVLPIMAKFDTPIVGEKLGFFIKAGFGPSWQASAYREGNEDPFDPFAREGSGLNRWDIGLYSGAGLEVKAGPGNILICADTYTGFNSSSGYDYTKSRSYGLSLGYDIDLH